MSRVIGKIKKKRGQICVQRIPALLVYLFCDSGKPSFSLVFQIRKKTKTESRGNKSPAHIPNFMLNCSMVSPSEFAQPAICELAAARSVTIPTSCGPIAAPMSPPAAIIAYINTPPVVILAELTTKLPGHIIAVQRPVRAQAISPKIGMGERIHTR